MMHRFFNHATVAKGLVLTTMTCTAMLSLFAPTSLTAVSADKSGHFGDFLAYVGLVLCGFGWGDVVFNDLIGYEPFVNLSREARHKTCVLLYSAIASLYAIFTFAALDWRVNTSWILVLDYLLVAFFTAVLVVSIALEKRDKP